MLERLVEPLTRGDPESPLRWTCKSTRTLAAELTARDHPVSHETGAQLLRQMNYSLQGNRKTEEGADYPDRDAQFGHINDEVRGFLAAGNPVISVDTKKKELVGNYENKGRQWHQKGRPELVKDHGFPDPTVPRAYPYGIYDLGRNTGFVNVGTDHETGAFASAGESTPLGIPFFRASTAPDSDGDGLPDDIEFAAQLDPNKVDTDGDGVDDFTADLHAGSLRAPSFLSSVVAGEGVHNIELVPAAQGQADGLYAYLAAGGSGVFIADVTDPLAPEVLANIQGIGVVQDVAVSPALQRAVVTSCLSGLGDPEARSGTRIFDVSNPRAPKLLTFLDFYSWEVEIAGDYAYILTVDDQLNGLLRAVNINSGKVENDLHLRTTYSYLVRDQDTLVLSDFSSMLLVDIAGPQII